MQHEAKEQEKLFRWSELMKGKYPELGMMYHIPNGGSRNRIEAAHLKAQGVKAGVPDICLPVPRGGHHGLYLELKYGKNKPTAAQTIWLRNLEKHGYAVAICWGWEKAKDVIIAYLNCNDTEKENIYENQ